MSPNITYISGLSHPFSWIHEDDQILLIIGMAWWFTLAAVLILFQACAFTHMRTRPMLVAASARITVLCAMLGVAYMYTSGRLLLFERADGVFVRTPLVVTNGAINVLLVYVGSLHCVLHPTYDLWVLSLGVLSAFQTTLASFVPAEQQWPGWVVGALFAVPIPVLWVSQHRRPGDRRGTKQVWVWVVVWLVFRAGYAALQLAGHTFAGKNGLDTTAELALMFVWHVFTLAPFVYAFYTMAAPPRTGKFESTLPNGDRVTLEARADV